VVRLRAYVSTTGLTVPGGQLATGNPDEDSVPNGNGEEITVVLNATPNEVTRIPPDSYRVWDSKYETWVSRGGPHHIHLAPDAVDLGSQRTLRDHFEEITHIELELAYQRDR
ncbi:MAG: hypothetical protein AAGJ83_06145, partial [Planctomycetota bacterium]